MTDKFQQLRFALALLMLGMLAGTGQAEDLTRLLPADTLLVVRLHNVPQLIQQWNASPFYRFYGDPRTGAFFGPLKQQIERFKKTMIDDKGVDAERLWRFFSGDLVLAGVATPGKTSPMEWVLIFQHNGDPGVLEKFKQAAAPDGARLERSTETVDGLNYTRLRVIREVAADVVSSGPKTDKHGKKKHKKSKNKNPFRDETSGELDLGSGARPDLSIPAPVAPGVAQSVAPGQSALKRQVVEEYDDYFGPSLIIHAGSRGRPMRKVLALLAHPDAAASLPGQADLQQLSGVMAGQGDISVYASVAALAQWFEGQGGGNGLGRLIDLRQLRLAEIRAAALNLDLQADRAALDLALLAPPPRLGISRVFFLPAGKPPEAARLAPPAAVAYSAAALPLKDLWGIFLETLQTTAPALNLALISQLQSFEKQVGIRLDRDLFGNLGGQVARFLLPDEPADSPRELATYMVSLKDSGQFRDTLLALLNYGSQTYQSYRIETTKAGPWPLWSLYTGRPGMESSGAATLHLCVTDQWLLVGARRTGIDAVVQRLRKPGMRSLRDQKSFQAAMRQLPAERFGEVFLDTGGIRKLLEMGVLQVVAKAGHDKKKGKGNDSGLFNLARLPEQPLWSEYFGPFGSAVSHSSELVRLRAFILYP